VILLDKTRNECLAIIDWLGHLPIGPVTVSTVAVPVTNTKKRKLQQQHFDDDTLSEALSTSSTEGPSTKQKSDLEQLLEES
jgi:hypothetical protein